MWGGSNHLCIDLPSLSFRSILYLFLLYSENLICFPKISTSEICRAHQNGYIKIWRNHTQTSNEQWTSKCWVTKKLIEMSLIFAKCNFNNASNKMVFAIILKSLRPLAVENVERLENPVSGKFTRFYHSPNIHAPPNFMAVKKYLFDESAEAVYDCYVIRHFGECIKLIKFHCQNDFFRC